MIARSLIVVAGLVGAAGGSQFPEFSQQYVQRLGGAVDALGEVVADFDASAAAEGMTRQAALDQMTGSGFIERRRADMAATMARHAQLAAQLEELRGAGPFMRAYHLAALDPEIAAAAWREFRPAMPLTTAGLIFGALGFAVGALLVTLPLSLFRRRRAPV